MMVWFDISHFFHFGVQIWCFTGVSIATSILHSINWIALYNLFMHSPLANQKSLDIFLSVKYVQHKDITVWILNIFSITFNGLCRMLSLDFNLVTGTVFIQTDTIANVENH